jgi:hypothetical protein
MPAFEAHFVAALVARHIDFHPFGKRIDHRGTDAMQTAAGFVCFAVKFAAGMQGGHDHFKRRLVLEFRVGIDGDAAAIVAHGQNIVGRKVYLDETGMPGHGFVHRIVQDLGGEVMQGVDVGPADIHAGAATHGLQALENLDVLGGISFGVGTWGCEQVLGIFGHGRIVKCSKNLAKVGGGRIVFLRESPC